MRQRAGGLATLKSSRVLAKEETRESGRGVQNRK